MIFKRFFDRDTALKRIKTEVIIREECGHEIRNASHWSVKSIACILYPVLSSRVHGAYKTSASL